MRTEPMKHAQLQQKLDWQRRCGDKTIKMVSVFGIKSLQ